MQEAKKESAARHAEAAAVKTALREAQANNPSSLPLSHMQANSPSSLPLSHMQADMAQVRSAASHYNMSNFDENPFL